jgi:hypothetical protein
MESDPVFQQYRDRRARMYERLDAVRAQASEWIERHAETWPELTDLALLEALHAEREQLLSDFQEMENSFIEYLLKKRRD